MSCRSGKMPVLPREPIISTATLNSPKYWAKIRGKLTAYFAVLHGLVVLDGHMNTWLDCDTQVLFHQRMLQEQQKKRQSQSSGAVVYVDTSGDGASFGGKRNAAYKHPDGKRSSLTGESRASGAPLAPSSSFSSSSSSFSLGAVSTVEAVTARGETNTGKRVIATSRQIHHKIVLTALVDGKALAFSSPSASSGGKPLVRSIRKPLNLTSYHGHLYGCELVDWLMERHYADGRPGAVVICQELMNLRLLAHYKQRTQFEDRYTLYTPFVEGSNPGDLGEDEKRYTALITSQNQGDSGGGGGAFVRVLLPDGMGLASITLRCPGEATMELLQKVVIENFNQKNMANGLLWTARDIWFSIDNYSGDFTAVKETAVISTLFQEGSKLLTLKLIVRNESAFTQGKQASVVEL
jgi:hypothetical protein